MRRLVFAGVTFAALGVVQPALSADLPAEPYKAAPLIIPVYDWTGFYVGISGGFSQGTSSNTYTITGFAPVGDSTKMDGGVFGGQIGYNWQPARNFVLGFEADLQGTWQNGSDNPAGTTTSTGTCPATSCTVTTNAVGVDEKLRWFGTARARLGFVPWDNVMLYVTGGAAFGEVEWNETTTQTATTTTTTNIPGFGPFTNTSTTTAINSPTATATHAGWTVGGGSEWVLSGGWTAKFEYLFVDLGTIGNSYVSNAGIVPTVVESSHVRDNIIRVGLNYRFGGPVVARY